MRRALVTALAVPVLLLSACGSDEPEVEDATTSEVEETTEEAPATEEPTEDETTDAAPTTEAPSEDTPTTEAPADDAPTDDSEATEAPGDDGESTETPGTGGEVEGGADGQAAADRTKEWLVAFVNADESVCDMMLDLESEGPMADNQTHYDVCVATLPAQASAEFTEEQASIFSAVEITGADVQGDTAVVDKDNFSDIFAAGIGDTSFTLKKIDGEWYVDLNASGFGR